jgi:ABC-type transport system involved in multi-copper enzyme maturation permease subunit
MIAMQKRNETVLEENVSQISGIARHEFAMSLRRVGPWLAYGMIFLFYALGLDSPDGNGLIKLLTGRAVLLEAGETVYMFNMLMPLVAGILAADRMQRDVRLNLRELQLSAPLKRWKYILGKYLGVLLALLLPALTCVLLYGSLAVLRGQAAPVYIIAVLVAFLAIALPSFAFVVAFSLACPLVMPLRVYQILFIGYWFWGNFLNPEYIFTISDTVLNASGIIVLQGIFRSAIVLAGNSLHTAMQAWLNLLVLSLCIAIVLLTLERYFAWQAKSA